MKKAIISLGLALGLWGLSASHAQAQLEPWHIDTYEVTSQGGTFTDISTDAHAVALTTTETNLLKVMFHATSTQDATPTFTKSEAYSCADDETLSGFPLGFGFNLCGYTMTHFVVSATGGVYFNNADMQGTYTSTPTGSGRWAVWTLPYVFKDATSNIAMATTAGQITQSPDKTPAYYLIEGEAGNHVLTVQYDYLLGATANATDRDEWIFQLKFHEASGKIEFIVKQLPYEHALTAAKGKYHRIVLSVTDFASTPTIRDANGQNTFVDPYGKNYMGIVPNGSNHRLFLAQTDDAYAANGWNSFTITGSAPTPSAPESATMRIDANGPAEGHTISFTPANAPETVEPLPAEAYTVSNQTNGTSSISANISFPVDYFTSLLEAHQAGPILAILSKSETPDYTLTKGVLYKRGDSLPETNGFRPVVLCNQMPDIQFGTGAAYTPNGYKITPVTIKAEGLEASTEYYVHLYRTAFAGKDAPAYSALCHTLPFKTSFGLPRGLETVGLADTNAVTVRITSDPMAHVLLLKASRPNTVAPSGKLEKGDKIAIRGSNTDFAEVLDILAPGVTDYKIALAKNEGCFIIAYSMKIEGDENETAEYTYSNERLYVAIGAAYKGLPGVVDFINLPFGIPNFEYHGINIRDKSYAELEPTIYRDLPFGYTRTEMTGNKSYGFGIGQPSYSTRAPHLVYAKTLIKDDVKDTIDFITPPIVADNNRILMTFNTQWFTSDDAGDIVNLTVGGEKDTRLYCAIEYAIGDGEWQQGASFHGYELPKAENGYFPVSFALIAEEKASFIGQKIRFRFISKFLDESEKPVRGFVGIGSIDVKEDKICQTVKNLTVNDALATGNQCALSWTDPNEPAAPSYVVEYKPADDTTDNWLSKKTNSARYTINGLKANTAYKVRVTADCGTNWGKAYTSNTITLSTLRAFPPYTESMAQHDTVMEVGGTNATITLEGPFFSRGVSTCTGTLPETGNAQLEEIAAYSPLGWSPGYSYAKQVDNQTPNSVGVRESATKQAWLLTPAIYIKSYGIDIPKFVRFKANCANKSGANAWVKGSVGGKYANARLYVLAERNGNFTMNDTVGTVQVGGVTIEDETFEFEVHDVDGRTRLAFYFYNPDATDAESNEDLMLFEIYDLEFDYLGTCLPIDDLTCTHTTTNSAVFTWGGSSTYYKFFWGLRSETGFSDSVTTTEKTYTLTGLTDGTRYKAKVEGFCNEDGTEKAPNTPTVGFMTDEICRTPDAFAVSKITSNGATFSSTSELTTLTRRLVYLTPQNDTVTKIFVQTDDQLVVNNLLNKTVYIAATQSVCGTDSSEISEPITFTTLADSILIMLNKMPNDEAGTVTGAGRYEKGAEATITATPAENYGFVAWIFGKDTVSTESAYTFKVTTAGTYTAVFVESTANEPLLQAAFNVSAQAGRLHIRNLKGLTIEDVTVYGLNGRRMARFSPNSREDLILPVNAGHTVLVVRVASEQGLATYKVYLQ